MEKENLKAGVLYKFFFTENEDLYFGYVQNDGSDELGNYMSGSPNNFDNEHAWSIYPNNNSGCMNHSVKSAIVATQAEKAWFQACIQNKSFVKMSEIAHYEIY